MATDTTASIITLVQPKRPQTAAERQRAYRERQKAKGQAVTKPVTTPAPVTKPVTRPVTVTVTPRVTPAQITQWLLVATAFGLGGVGMAVNGTFAKSLASTETAGWLFLAIGVAADAMAMAMPAAAAAAWQKRQRLSAAAGWLIWIIAFIFVVNAGIGFASLNVTDVTLSRASRVTPAVETARNALNDAMATRDRECATGTGKTCRTREDAVASARKNLETAMSTVAQTADPQTEGAARIVTWLSGGMFKPSSDDFATMRLIMIALLPQLGGLLLMVGRAAR